MKAIILTLFLLKTILGWAPTDICIRNKVLRGQYDKLNKYSIVQVPLNCLHTSNPYECGPNYCALNKNKCISFIEMNFMYKVLKQNMNDFLSLAESIRDCAYSLNVDQDICMNAEKCYTNSIIALKSGLTKLSVRKLVDCKCAHKHSCNCGKNYCAIHSNACGLFEAWLNSTQSGSAQSINRCDST